LFDGLYWQVLLFHRQFMKLDNFLGQFFIFLFIMCEFGFYVVIRQLVNAKEWLSACECALLLAICKFLVLLMIRRAWAKGFVEKAIARVQDVPGTLVAAPVNCTTGSICLLS
jgi:hypothetical protein